MTLADSEVLSPPKFGFSPPSFSDAELAQIALTHFGLSGEFKNLSGERDQNSRITTAEGKQYVLKIATASAVLETLDLEIQALLHLQSVDSSLPLPRVFPASNGEYIARIRSADGKSHYVRVLSYLPGLMFHEVAPLGLDDLRQVGKLEAKVSKALRGFFHPAAKNYMAWDLNCGNLENPLLHDASKPYFESHIKPVLQRWKQIVKPRLGGLRAQIIHHDGHNENLLWDLDGSRKLSGLIDFGDIVYNPVIMDIAIAFSSFVTDHIASHNEDSWLSTANALLEGFNSVRLIEEEELELLLDLTLARLALTVLLFDFRVKQRNDSAFVDYACAETPRILKAIEVLLTANSKTVSNHFRAACGYPASYDDGDYEQLLRRRQQVLGSSYTHFYDRPLHIVRGQGVWLWDAAGRKYLDCYNNVPSVGHCHPRVVNRITRQIKTLNTHTRYLHETLVELCERLVETLPEGLDTVIIVCTGTEANDLAAQMARHYTAENGLMVTEASYHGNSSLITQLSRSDHRGEDCPDYVGVVEPPNTYRGPFQEGDCAQKYADLLDPEIKALQSRGQGLAAFMMDSSFDSNGVLNVPEGYVKKVYDKVHAAGGLVIHDEVQSGFCRMGDHFWGFMDHAVIPDIVTMGKPMGAGHPIAAVVTTSEIASSFAERYSYFNTFGGNPVAAAAALAVLDVIRDEKLLQQVHQTGNFLASGLQEIASRYPAIGNVQGKGLFWGLDLIKNPDSKDPDRDFTRKVTAMLRDHGILAGSTGLYGNVLKFRPPLVFNKNNAEQLLSKLNAVFESADG